MKKRATIMLTALSLTAALTIPAQAAASLTNFTRERTYTDTFTDVSPEDWYYKYAAGAYEYSLFDGKSADTFDPGGQLTVAEAVKLAAVLYKNYYTGSTHFESSEPWYRTYIDYALPRGIIDSAFKNYEAPASRAEFALMLAAALPAEATTPIGTVPDGAIPDVLPGYSYGPAVYRLYRAGILTGSDEDGTFFPNKTITRAEAAAIILRMLDPASRISLSLAPHLSAEQIYTNASPAVFFVEVFDSEGDLAKTGSGFFISESGLAVTNYHVVNGAHSAQITTDDGTVYEVAGIYDYDWKKDIALIQIEGEGFPYLEAADSDNVMTGAAVYALGSPLSLQATLSRGIISGTERVLDGIEFIQTDAPISPGSSGGALLDSSGRAIGITTAVVDGGQNLNLAVPINLVFELNTEEFVPLKSILTELLYYHNRYPAPDFGAYFDIKAYASNKNTSYYLLSDLAEDYQPLLDEYRQLLEQNFFTLYGYYTKDDNPFMAFINSKHGIFVLYGIEEYNGEECLSVFAG